MSGVSHPALNRIERQESSPRLSTVEAIEEALRDVDIHFSIETKTWSEARQRRCPKALPAFINHSQPSFQESDAWTTAAALSRYVRNS